MKFWNFCRLEVLECCLKFFRVTYWLMCQLWLSWCQCDSIFCFVIFCLLFWSLEVILRPCFSISHILCTFVYLGIHGKKSPRFECHVEVHGAGEQIFVQKLVVIDEVFDLYKISEICWIWLTFWWKIESFISRLCYS